MTCTDPDAPYQRLADLPRTLWLPAVTNSSGATARRLADLATWRSALQAGALPEVEADFGDAAALLPLRTAVGALGLPALTRTAPARGTWTPSGFGGCVAFGERRLRLAAAGKLSQAGRTVAGRIRSGRYGQSSPARR